MKAARSARPFPRPFSLPTRFISTNVDPDGGVNHGKPRRLHLLHPFSIHTCTNRRLRLSRSLTYIDQRPSMEEEDDDGFPDIKDLVAWKPKCQQVSSSHPAISQEG
jgi:hypothetical protein